MNMKWTEIIPTVLLGLRSAIKCDMNYSLAQMVCGHALIYLGEMTQ